MSNNSPLYLDMYNLLKRDLSIETTQDQINETFYHIRQTKKQYGEKFINEIYREVFKSINESITCNRSIDYDSKNNKENLCQDCVILQVIRNLLYNKPLEFIKD